MYVKSKFVCLFAINKSEGFEKKLSSELYKEPGMVIPIKIK